MITFTHKERSESQLTFLELEETHDNRFPRPAFELFGDIYLWSNPIPEQMSFGIVLELKKYLFVLNPIKYISKEKLFDFLSFEAWYIRLNF